MTPSDHSVSASVSGRSRARWVASWFGGQVVLAGMFFVISVVTARLLGASGKGELSAWTLVPYYGFIAVAFGLPTGLGRTVLAGRSAGVGSLVARHALLTAGPALLAAAIAIVLGADRLGVLLFVVIGLPAMAVVEDAFTVFQAARHSAAANLTRASAMVIVVVAFGATWFWWRGAPREWVWVMTATGPLITGAFMLAALRRSFGTRPEIGLRAAASEGTSSWPAFAFDRVLLRADQVLAGAAPRKRLAWSLQRGRQLERDRTVPWERYQPIGVPGPQHA